MATKGQLKANLIFWRRQALNSGLLMERKIWRIPRSTRYPEGIKYRMVLVDPKVHSVILLYDNHWPKGPHVHWDNKERSYEFKGIEKLLEDFFQEAKVEEARYHENKKDHY